MKKTALGRIIDIALGRGPSGNTMKRIKTTPHAAKRGAFAGSHTVRFRVIGSPGNSLAGDFCGTIGGVEGRANSIPRSPFKAFHKDAVTQFRQLGSVGGLFPAGKYARAFIRAGIRQASGKQQQKAYATYF